MVLKAGRRHRPNSSENVLIFRSLNDMLPALDIGMRIVLGQKQIRFQNL